MTFWKWSTSPASNATADSTCPWPEGMAPSQVNDSARGTMAALAKYRDDMSGKLVTSGTSTAYAVTSNQGFDTLAHLDGAMIAFVPHTDSGATPTLSVDGLTAKPLRGWTGTDLLAGVLKQGTPYIVFYNNTSGEFVLHSYFVNPGEIPIGAGIDYWGSTVPSTNFAFPYGQAISRTANPICFARLGTTYGSGDGSTTFNLPDKRGRISAGVDNMGGTGAGRLRPDRSGITGTTLGAAGGEEMHQLLVTELAIHKHNNTLTDPGHSHIYSQRNVGPAGSRSDSEPLMATTSSNISTESSTTGITIFNQNEGSNVAHNNVQPTIVCNYIIRIA